ncbi:glycoside hydrolase family 3 protein [Altererythrobacter salegens]|uniref:beta-glucosidase n=2 Tax=Croceibacterium salegens TaxID=1737568 RepID=A0A6I4SZ64_9SPHN|nr:glycoside hydrolase family 3 protein [Croceibacterium salegens]
MLLGIGGLWLTLKLQSWSNLSDLGERAGILEIDGLTFRDLNKNGELDPYEDRRVPIDERVDDLLRQMTLEEKAGVMFINFTSVSSDGELSEGLDFFDPTTLLLAPNSELLVAKHMNSFSLIATVDDPTAFASWQNALQKAAERTRLGIPVTLATDPRHGVATGGGIALPSGAFSKWPDPIGLAATRDAELVREFADIVRQEYRAVGLRLALHPSADLATEPRWARVAATFGEDAALSAELTAAYVRGLQGEKLDARGVAAMVKHFSGGGPQADGEDAHFEYGKEQVYPGDNFDYHLIPFEDGAFPAGAAQVMPYYGIPIGQTDEDVGFSFNRSIVTSLLREHYGFDGVICTDWGLISDNELLGIYTILPARAWGVEDLTPRERMLKLIDAGVDQFGGEQIPELLVELVRSGDVPEARLDESVRRILRDKFRLGLFDDPYVDAEAAQQVVGSDAFVAAGIEAQRRSLVLLKNRDGEGGSPLPLIGRPRLYIENIDPDVAAKFGELVATPEEADFAIIRTSAPYEPRNGLFESLVHAGALDFPEPEKRRLTEIAGKVPLILDIYLDRPAVFPEIAQSSAAVIGSFGANDEVLLDLIFGRFTPSGRLPFELPSSMQAVEAQFEDVPHDSRNPLYPFGYGLSFDIPKAG